MKIFLAGAGGVIGRRLTPLLRAAGHTVVGTTRSTDKADAIARARRRAGRGRCVRRGALARAVSAAAPQVVMHQLTDLPAAPGTPGYEEGLERNARLRIEGTRNLVAAAKAAGVKRMIAQSIAFVYAPGDGARVETDPLDLVCDRRAQAHRRRRGRARTGDARAAGGIVLRYGYLYGPGTWFGENGRARVARRCRGAGRAACRQQRQARHLQHRRG